MGWGGLPLPACRGALQGLAGHAVCVGLLWALVAAPALVLPFLIRAAVGEGVATATSWAALLRRNEMLAA